MANSLFAKAKEGFLSGEISWQRDVIRAVLIEIDMQPSIYSAQFLSDIPESARVATSPPFTGKTSISGVADAEDLSFGNVTGATVGSMAIYQDTGKDTTSRLILLVDRLGAGGFPITPNGSEITIAFDDGSNRIFRL